MNAQSFRNQLAKLLKENYILTVSEVASLFRVTAGTVRRWAEQDRDSGGKEGLHGFKIGKKLWRFSGDDVLGFYMTQSQCSSERQAEQR
jgi:hypothetical protein